MSEGFDWSPGGCCCDVSGIFDIYMFNTGPTQPIKFVRRTTLRPNGKPVLYQSNDAGAIDWFIDPSSTVQNYTESATGFPAFGGRVWQHQQRGTGSIEDTGYTALYDTETRQELFSVKTGSTFLGGYSSYPRVGFIGQGGKFLSATQTKIVRFLEQTSGNGFLYVLDDAGVLTTTAAATGEIRIPAWRNWPDGVGKSATALYRGNISVMSGSLAIANKTTVRSGSNLNWVSYDSSPTHWAGVIREDIANPFPQPGFVSNYHLYINGVLIKTLRQSTTYAPTNGPFGEVHVCHPHETLGDGWIGVPMVKWSVEPDAGNPGGNLFDANKPWHIVFYKNGVQSWTLQEPWPLARVNSRPPRIDHSGDRWIYVDDLISTDTTIAIPIKDHWKHDGSQSWRTGQLNTAGTDTIPDYGWTGGGSSRNFPGNWDITAYAVVQNSAAIENALPLDFPPTV